MVKVRLKIILSDKIGFCFGVKKSIDLAKKVVEKSQNKVYMLGSIINNPQVLEYFMQNGVKVIENLDEIPENSSVITRAHGVSPLILQQAIQKRLNIIETTCPYVKKMHKIAKYLSNNNYYIVVFGDKMHPEISSLLDIINHNALVINSDSEARKIDRKKKIGFFSQTTKNRYKFYKLSSVLMGNTDELRIFNTICKATSERQNSVSKLARKVHVMLVIGGSKSANTSRLAEICQNQGVKTYHIETKNQMKYEWFNPEDIVGIASGTSTPDYVISEIVKQIKVWYT